MAAIPSLITVAQYLELPDDPAHLYELHHGEIVEVSQPKHKHARLQLRLQDLLREMVGSFGRVIVEYGYRALTEFELRAADVAVVSHTRWKSVDPEDFLRGAPDLVIEVKSPSNTRAQLRDLATMWLANGCLEFWIVDPDNESVTVLHRDGTTTLYIAGQEIPLDLFGAKPLGVADIFREL